MLLIIGMYRVPISLLYSVINVSICRGTHEKCKILENLLMEVI